MKIAAVIGSAISTIKSPRVQDPKILLCRETDPTGKEKIGISYAALDLVDAGVGDLVLTCHGSASRQTHLTSNTPVDSVIIGVLDHMEVDGEVIYKQ